MADLRMMMGGASYREISAKADPVLLHSLLDEPVDYLCRPAFSESEAVFRRLAVMLGLESEFTGLPELARPFRTIQYGDFGKGITLSSKEKSVYKLFLESYRRSGRYRLLPRETEDTPTQWVNEALNGMDERIHDLIQAFRAIRSRSRR